MKRGAAILLFVGVVGFLFPQTPNRAPDKNIPSASGASSEKEGDLFLETLLEDIRTAGYYELLAWCRELGLPDTGSAQELRSRLYGYYHFEEPSAPKAASAKRRIEIRSARETETFKIIEVDENYILFEGDVQVEVWEEEVVHRIFADRILYNQTENILTAEGNIRYMLKRGEQEEQYQGDKITFNINTWEGVFFSGGMSAQRQVQERSIDFFYFGDTITRLKNDTILMDQGKITSRTPPTLPPPLQTLKSQTASPQASTTAQQPASAAEETKKASSTPPPEIKETAAQAATKDLLEDPVYHIRARKIWVLAPNEWAVQHAWLYVGHVPVLYMPFFFLPGEEFFFHPVLGYRDREGNFLQTTTYLVGRKKHKQSPFSFIAVAEKDQDKAKKEIQGLFLRQVEGEYVPSKNPEWFLKLLLDLYSRLGGFAGISGNFTPGLTFQGGLGFSRSLFASGNTYSPFYPDDEEKYRSYWNRSWLFGAELPYRYGLESTFSVEQGDLQLSGRFEYYSDPFFTSDFYNRSEDIDWGSMLGMTEENTGLTEVGEKWNLSWELGGKADFSRGLSSPYLNSLAISSYNMSLYFQSRETEGVSSDPILQVDPSRRFYYPVTLKLPSLSMIAGGELLRIPASGPAAAPKASPPEQKPGETGAELELKPPSSLPVDKEKTSPAPSGSKEAEQKYRLPEAQADEQLLPEREPASFQVSYKVRPNLLVERSFANTEWASQEEVDFQSLYTTLETSGDTSLDYALVLREKLMNYSGSLITSAVYRTRFNQSADEDATWESLVMGDYEATQLDFKAAQGIQVYPWFEMRSWEKSRFAYSLNWTFYRYLLDNDSTYGHPLYTGIGPQWNRDTVSENLFQADFVYQPHARPNSLALDLNIPPVQGSAAGKLEFYVWLLKTTLSASFLEEEEKVWVAQPVILQETLELSPQSTITEELRFDPDHSYLLKSISSTSLWGFQASFTAERMLPVTFDMNEGWVTKESEELFLPSRIDLSYELLQQSLFFWKNRSWLELTLKSSYYMHLQRFTETELSFSLTLTYFLYRFMEVRFTTTSSNNRSYRYFSALADRVGEAWVDPLSDLADSFKFWDSEARYRSAFKLKSISLAMVHHLDEWDLTLTYEGSPEVVTDSAGRLEYEWESTFSIFLQWLPIPELKSRIYDEGEGLQPRG